MEFTLDGPLPQHSATDSCRTLARMPSLGPGDDVFAPGAVERVPMRAHTRARARTHGTAKLGGGVLFEYGRVI